MTATGWGWPDRAIRPHYFEQGRSLCGRWLLRLGLSPDRWPGNACNRCEAVLAHRAELRGKARRAS